MRIANSLIILLLLPCVIFVGGCGDNPQANNTPADHQQAAWTDASSLGLTEGIIRLIEPYITDSLGKQRVVGTNPVATYNLTELRVNVTPTVDLPFDGVVVVSHSGSFNNPSDIATVNASGIRYKGATLSGSVRLSVINAEQWSVVVSNVAGNSDARISYPDSGTVSFKANYFRRKQLVSGQVVGATYSGDASGITRSGQSFTSTAESSLIFSYSCPYTQYFPTSGRSAISVPSQPVRRIDYGSGSCDNAVLVIYSLGNVTITLPK